MPNQLQVPKAGSYVKLELADNTTGLPTAVFYWHNLDFIARVQVTALTSTKATALYNELDDIITYVVEKPDEFLYAQPTD